MRTESTEASSPKPHTRRGTTALLHPLAVLSLLTLIVNDHFLKDAFGTPLTGKLSDIAGAIVVPLLIATALERWTNRSIEIAMASTALVLTAINVSPVADRLYEAALSMSA